MKVFIAEESVKGLLPLPKVSSCALSDPISKPSSETFSRRGVLTSTTRTYLLCTLTTQFLEKSPGFLLISDKSSLNDLLNLLKKLSFNTMSSFFSLLISFFGVLALPPGSPSKPELTFSAAFSSMSISFLLPH